MSQTPRELEAFLYEQMPLARSMQIRVDGYDGQLLRLSAPLEPNINHQGTAFGGSIASLGILASWSLLHLKIQEMDLRTHLVIQRSEVNYLAPIHETLHAEAALPDTEAWAAFTDRLLRRGKARVDLSATIRSRGGPAATHVGRYVAVCLPTV